MQDNDKIVITGLTDEEFEFIENIRKENAEKLSKMDKNKLLEHYNNIYTEQNLNFEKQINGTTYKVNTYFRNTSEYTIFQNFLRIFEK